MKTILGGRGHGKTTELIRLAAEAEANGEVCYIVCHSLDEAHRIAEEAKKMGLTIGFPVTYDEYTRSGMSGRFVKHVLIDNLEMFLAYISPIHVLAVTINTE